MTTTITSSPRRSIAAWVPAAALIVLLIGILVSSGARLTWEVPTATVLPARTTTRPSAVTVERAERLSAVRHELTVLRAAGQQIPAIRFGCTTGSRCWPPRASARCRSKHSLRPTTIAAFYERRSAAGTCRARHSKPASDDELSRPGQSGPARRRQDAKGDTLRGRLRDSTARVA
jgi:hypothetical protein